MNRKLNWSHVPKPSLGITNVLSKQIADIERRQPGIIPDLRNGQSLFIASDYGGHHSKAGHQILSFLITDNYSTPTWLMLQKFFRELYLAGYPRRISYKAIHDGVIARSLEQFLTLADTINGILFTIAIDKRIEYIVLKENDKQIPSQLKDWKISVYEKMLRIINIISMLVAGLSAPGQDVYWLTDEDDIVANESRTDDLLWVLRQILIQYLTHPLRDIFISTTAGDNEFAAEDLAAIPDLIAGCLSDVLTINTPDQRTASTTIIHPTNMNCSAKADKILKWYLQTDQPLRRLLCEIGPANEPSQYAIYWREFITYKSPNSYYILG